MRLFFSLIKRSASFGNSLFLLNPQKKSLFLLKECLKIETQKKKSLFLLKKFCFLKYTCTVIWKSEKKIRKKWNLKKLYIKVKN